MKHIAIYVRVSSKQQDHKSQLPDLERWATEQNEPIKWYEDKQSGKTMNRPGWNELEQAMRAGKVSKIVVWKQDRLGRTARELLALRDELIRRKIDLVIIAGGMMGLDTPEGRLWYTMLAGFAEYDNEIRSERIKAGQSVARASGKTWGGSKPGKRKRVTPTQIKMIVAMKREGEPITAIAQAVGLSRPTIYDVLKQHYEPAEAM